MSKNLLLAAFLLSGAAMPALADSDPISDLVLFEAGLAEVSRPANPEEPMTLEVPVRDVEDILKSLTLHGENITGGEVRLGGSAPVEDAFSALPVKLPDLAGPQNLLAALSGTKILIGDETGTVVGTTRIPGHDGKAEGLAVMLMLEDGSLAQHPVTASSSFKILDDHLREGILKGLQAGLAERAGTRFVDIEVFGSGEAVISYTVAAPAWKTAYRAINRDDGEVDLQAWAVVENAMSEDWNGVSLTLSSGAPRTIRSDLFSRRWPDRETMAGSLAGMVEENLSMAADGAMEKGVRSFAMAESMPDIANLQGTATISDGAADSRFTFPEPVTLAAGHILSLPFLSEKVEARHNSVWTGSGYDHKGSPSLELEVTNTLPMRLPAGIMTVEDAKNGYLGDATLPLLVPGKTERVIFGADQKIEVNETVSQDTLASRAKIRRGRIEVTDTIERKTTYHVTAPDGEDHHMTLLHPQDKDWQVRVNGTEGELTRETDANGRTYLRADVAVKGKDGTDILVTETLPVKQVQIIADLTPEALLEWSGRALSEEDRAYLDVTARMMRNVADLRDKIALRKGDLQDLVAEQERVAGLMGRMEKGSDAYDLYLDRVTAAEKDISRARADISDLSDALDRARKDLDDKLAE